MYDFSTKRSGQLERILFLKLHDKMDIFKEDLEILKDMVSNTADSIDEFQAIEYKIEEINDALNNPLKLYLPNNQKNQKDSEISSWLDGVTNIDRDIEIDLQPNMKPNKRQKKYDQSDIRNWLDEASPLNCNNKFLSSDLFDKNVYHNIDYDSDLNKAIELSKNEINNFEDDLELQLALEMSRNDNDIFQSKYIKTIDN